MSRRVDLTNPIFTDLETARKHFEAIRWPNGPYCPYCGVVDRVAPLGGNSMGPGWYHCKDCRRKFTAAVGTIYERSHIPLTRWFLATHLMCASKKAMSAHQLGRMLGVPYKTAWFMTHRIREGMRELNPTPSHIDKLRETKPNKSRSRVWSGRRRACEPPDERQLLLPFFEDE